MTATITDEMSSGMVTSAARKAKLADGTDEVSDAADLLEGVLAEVD